MQETGICVCFNAWDLGSFPGQMRPWLTCTPNWASALSHAPLLLLLGAGALMGRELHRTGDTHCMHPDSQVSDRGERRLRLLNILYPHLPHPNDSKLVAISILRSS